MKLSEAILKGCELGPQHHGGMFGNDDSSCAMGAAYLAIYGKDLTHLGTAWADPEWFAIRYEGGSCPHIGCKKESYSSAHIIIHLNDFHKWSREAIALWVQTLENKVENEKQAESQSAEVPYTEVVNGECVKSR